MTKLPKDKGVIIEHPPSGRFYIRWPGTADNQWKEDRMSKQSFASKEEALDFYNRANGQPTPGSTILTYGVSMWGNYHPIK